MDMNIKCKCGCGTEFEEKDKRGRIRRYVRGHGPQERVLPLFREDSRLKRKEIMKNKFREGYNVWNKGKKEEREEVLRRQSESHKGLDNHQKGRQHSVETKLKMSLLKKGDNHWIWRGGCRQYYQHIAHDMVKQKLMIDVKNPFVIHHLNGNYKDNRIENLVVIDRHIHPTIHKEQRLLKC
jgi:hypothetical protein